MATVRAILEFRHLPLLVHRFIWQAWQQALERRGQTSHDRILGGPGFENLQDRMIAKAGIGSYPQLSDVARYVEEAGRHQLHTPIPRASVTRAQFSVPEIGRVGLDAQERMVETFPAIVADFRTFLMPEDGDHAAVEIEDQAGTVRGMHEILQQSIIHAVQLREKRVGSVV